MNTEINGVISQSQNLLQNKHDVDTIKKDLFQTASIANIEKVLFYCDRFKLDPYAGVYNIVSISGKEEIWRTVDFYRILAQRTNQYIGRSAPVYGPAITKTFTTSKGKSISITFPEYTEVTVHRLTQGKIGSYVGHIRWEEMYKNKVSDSRGMNSTTSPYMQADKSAEKRALMIAFTDIIPMFNTGEFNEFENNDNQEPEEPVNMAAKILNKLNSNYITYDGIGKEVPMQSSSIPDGVMDAKDIWPNNKTDSYEYLEWIYNYSEEIKGRVDGCLNFLKLTNITELPTEKASSLISKIEKEYPALKHEWDRHRKKIWE